MNQTINNLISAVSRMCEDVENGEESPLEALANLKELEKTMKDAIQFVMKYAVDEASKYEKTFNEGDHQFTLVNGRRTFSFKNIKEWNEINKQKKSCEDKYKQLWMSAKNGVTCITDDGEIVDLPDVTYAKDSVSVKVNHNIVKA